MSEEISPSQVDPPAPQEDDGSLDNFFKKKDKKGKKKKLKKTEKSGEDKDSKTKRKDPGTESKKEIDNTKDDNVATSEQEEWIDFEDESKRDYSDLKIQNLQITESEEAPPVEEPEYNEAGELIPRKPAEGPWNKKSTVQKSEVKKSRPAVVDEPPKKSGAYRPPQARLGSSQMTPSGFPKRGVRKQQAPEIHNEMQFPSLSDAVKDTANLEGFEVVKAGAKASTPWRSKRQQAQSSDIQLGNQFSALNTGY